MNVQLGINTGFALNRFTPPEDWIPLVADTFKLKIVQFTADLLNPSLPDDLIQKQLTAIVRLKNEYGLRVEHTFTSAFTRVNHLAHPDPDVRRYWVRWFYRFCDISVALGARSMGSHFGILTARDNADPSLKAERFAQNVDGWAEISKYAKKAGLEYLTWEPMSVAREMGETLSEARRIHQAVNQKTALPMKMCLDVDHGDVLSENSDDTNPFAWIAAFGKESPIIHIKQTLRNKGGHWPFTPEYNKSGKITPENLLKALEDAGVEDVTLLLELSFREREPFDSRVIDDIKASVDYWRPYVSV